MKKFLSSALIFMSICFAFVSCQKNYMGAAYVINTTNKVLTFYSEKDSVVLNPLQKTYLGLIAFSDNGGYTISEAQLSGFEVKKMKVDNIIYNVPEPLSMILLDKSNYLTHQSVSSDYQTVEIYEIKIQADFVKQVITQNQQ